MTSLFRSAITAFCLAAAATGIPAQAAENSAIIPVSGQKELDILKSGDKPLLVEFYASWCGWCKKLAPHLEQVAAEHRESAVVAKVNCEKSPATEKICNDHHVGGYPTLITYKAGKKIERTHGLDGYPFKTKGELQGLLIRAGRR